MYHAIVRRKAKGIFDSLSEGDIAAATADLVDDVHHVFPGDNALGGERHTKAAMLRWFDRVYTVFPDLNFEVRRVTAKGWPWNTWVSVEWVDRATTPDGVPYVNEGAHWIQLKWGKGTYVHAYLDTEKVTVVCDRLAAGGMEEAAAPQITD